MYFNKKFLSSRIRFVLHSVLFIFQVLFVGYILCSTSPDTKALLYFFTYFTSLTYYFNRIYAQDTTVIICAKKQARVSLRV